MDTDIDTLRALVGETGEVRLAYGGFKTVVLVPSSFPWERVLQLLLAIHHDVWVTKHKDHIVITSKPSAV